MVSRVDRGWFASWWWTIDKPMLFGLIALMFLGLILSFAASPAVAEHINLDRYYFVKKHAIFAVPALIALFGLSFCSPAQVRRIAFIVLGVSICFLVYTLFAGTEIKGARRWISLAGFTLQPSELMKPGFVVVTAWLFSEHLRRPDIPANIFAMCLLAVVCILLVSQPDIGQTALITLSWGSIFFLAGLSWMWIALFALLGALGMTAAYFFLPHVTGRIDRFLNPESGDTFQVDKAMEAFMSGGWFGQGPGEGVVKRILPDSHTDFVFAVIAEEFGIVLSLFVVVMFSLLVLRGFMLAMRQDDMFVRLAISGLVILFGVQAAINMAVNLQLAPAKGMTLPFISYGGSSLLSVAIGMGMVLGLARKNARSSRGSMRVYRGEGAAPLQPPKGYPLGRVA